MNKPPMMDNTEVKTLKDLPDLTELSIIELLHDIKNESVLIRKGATGTVLVSPDGFPDSGDVAFDLNDKTDYEIIGEELEDSYPMFSLERNKDFKVIQYFDEKSAKYIPAAEYEEQWKKAQKTLSSSRM